MSKTLATAQALLKARELKGLSEYGKTLDRWDLTDLELVNHAIEEAADQLMY